LHEIENRANNLSTPSPSQTTFIEKRHAATALKKAADNGTSDPASQGEIDDGRQHMHQLFVETKSINAVEFDQLWPKVSFRETLRQPNSPFINVLSERGIVPVEKSLTLICEKTRLPYLPIEKYDVDVEFARTFPKESCLRWCVLPFDRISKSVLVATANPYNKQAGREIEAHSQSPVIWYVSQPSELMKVLRKIFR